MRFLKKPIFTGFLPNLLPKDVTRALSFCLPWNWSKLQKGDAVQKAERRLQDFFGIAHAITYDSGRSGLSFALQALGIQKNDEVLVQAYTCLVVSNAIIFSGAKPVYVDITDNFTMDPIDLEKKVTPRTKVLIVQHTFGIAADLDALLALAQKYNLKVIEDCAHSMGGKYHGKKLGTFGDIAMLSFGTEKPVSCGRGGALLTNNDELSQKLRKFQASLPHTSKNKILQQLVSSIIFFVAKPLYNLQIGKIILSLAKKFHLGVRIIEESEKRGAPATGYPTQLPNAFAITLLQQLDNLKEFNEHRESIAQYYLEQIKSPYINIAPALKNIQAGEPLLRFPLRVRNPKKLLTSAKRNGMLLGDWYNSVIAPQTNFEHMGYSFGSCPHAEQIAKESVNLPTSIHISKKDAQRIVSIVNNYVD